MEVKSGYKQTDVGIVPEDWEVQPLNRIATVVRGGSPRPAGDPRYFNGSYIPWLTVSALTQMPPSRMIVAHTASNLTEEGSLHSRTLMPGTLVVSNSGATLGVAKILGIKCCANDGIAALLNLRESMSAPYLAHFVNTKTAYLRDVVAPGNGQPNLNTDLIGAFKVPIPPTRIEQEAIAGALSDTDAFIESLEQLLTKQRQIKQGVMQELLSGQRRLPGFTGEWAVRRLGDLGRWTGGMTPAMRNPDYWQPEAVPWVASGDVKSARLASTALSISEFAVRQGGAAVLPAGSVMLVTRSGILRRHLPVALNMIPMAINQDIKALLPNSDVLSEFLMQSITSHGDRILARCLKSGTTVESIEYQWLKEFPLPIPPLGEQAAIGAVLSDMDSGIAALGQQLAKAHYIKDGMTQELLIGRIRLA